MDQCKTADDVRALARKFTTLPQTPVVRLTKPEPPPMPALFPAWMSYGASIRIASNGSRIFYRTNTSASLSVIPRVSEIVAAVACHYDKRTIDILSKRRTQDIVRPRQVAMYLACRLTQQSLPAIGRLLGGRDHTTVLHGRRKIEKALAYDERLPGDIASIKQLLGVAGA